ncbi:(d)CMP kinase [Acinetobacter sp. HY1485]|uniref:(d)CMP kinase n=1 Tax=Acinetobacter sp. HY1485 TaxID=2970918 RepID=UPI0022B9C8ED|nr:(d)CMP kinase [Acinetobacter sp. HY1485]
MTTPIITIDGPSGSGKGTLASKIAQHYGFHLLDSGAIYRLLGLSLAQLDLIDKLQENLPKAIKIAESLDISFKPNNQKLSIFLDKKDVTEVIRTEQVGEYASKVATIVELRQALLERQKKFAQTPGLVADGRDMGTIIFPQAEAKIYLTASAGSRAQRRFKQLQGLGQDVKIEAILANIEARDKRDTERTVAPLKPAENAYIIDSSLLSIDEVFSKMVTYINSKLA